MTIFWDISKWNRRQTKWNGGSTFYEQIEKKEMTFNYLRLLVWNQRPHIPMQKGWILKNPNLKETKEERSDLLKTNQPHATPPALGRSRGYKDQPEAKIGNNWRKKKKVRRSVAEQQIQEWKLMKPSYISAKCQYC